MYPAGKSWQKWYIDVIKFIFHTLADMTVKQVLNYIEMSLKGHIFNQWRLQKPCDMLTNTVHSIYSFDEWWKSINRLVNWEEMNWHLFITFWNLETHQSSPKDMLKHVFILTTLTKHTIKTQQIWHKYTAADKAFS